MSPWDEVAEEIRALARSQLARFDITTCPTDVRALCHALQIRLVSEPCWEDPNYPGAAIWSRDADYRAIVVNSLLPITRWTFTIAHEVGHIVMEHCPPRNPIQERCANVYASEILMPTDRVLAQLRQHGPNARYLAGLNGVSLAAMQWRLLEISALLV